MSIHSSAAIHPTAIVEEGAKIEAEAKVGPYAFIGSEVTLGKGVEVKSHCAISGWTDIGENTVIFPFAAIGDIPQDLTYRGEKTRLVVGKRNCIREGVTMNTGTSRGRGITQVGDDCMFMIGAHVGHDSLVGNHVTMANQAALGGHSVVEDFAVISGLSGVHQFVRVGRGSFVGALTFVNRDVLPYSQVQGSPGKLRGANLIGLQRKNFARKDIDALVKAFKLLFKKDKLTFKDRISELDAKGPHCDSVHYLLEFVKKDSKRKYMMP